MTIHMSEEDRAKADQLVHHFYAKTVAVISQARGAEAVAGATGSTPPIAAGPDDIGRRRTVSGATKTKRSNKWFNLELPDPDAFRSQLKTWRTVSSSIPPAATPTTANSSSSPLSPPSNGPPPLVLQVVLDSSDLTWNQTVVLSDERGRRVRVESPASPSLEQQNRYGHAIVRPASAAGYARKPISPYSPPASSTGVGAVHGKHQSGTSSAGTRSPARGSNASANATPPIVLEQWTLNLVPFSSAETESRRRQRTGGDGPSSHPGSSEPSPVSSATASTSYSYPSATALPPPSPVELATVYKHSILHFRTLYSLVRTLPAFSLARTLARRRKGLATAPSGGGNRAEGELAGSADRDQLMAGGGARPGAMTRHAAGLGVRVRLVQAPSVGGSKHRPSGHEGLPPAPADEDEQDEVVAVDVSLDGGDDASSALRSSARDGAATAKRRPTSEKIVFPGVPTPFGTLVLSLEYRTNTDFGVEDIETLLSSRFIDEDFFRPTVARYTSTAAVPTAAGGASRDPPAPDEVVRPGSLPISAAFQPRAGDRPVSGSPSGLRREASRAEFPPPPTAPDHPSYGSLSARRSGGASDEPTAEAPLRRESIVRAATAPLPVPASSPRTNNSFAHGSASSSRYDPEGGARAGVAQPATSGPSSATAIAGTPSSGAVAGTDVEPAFISLSRARGTSFGGTGSGIQRSSPLSGSPAGSASPSPAEVGTAPSVARSLPRRPSLTSSGASGSPIFRAGSYVGTPGLSSSPSQGFSYGYGHAYSYGSPGAGIVRHQQQQQVPVSGSPSSQHSFNMSRSPLGGPPTFPGGATGPAPTPRPVMHGVRTSSYTGTGGIAAASSAYGSQGSYTASRSYGRTGSSAGSAEWPAGAAGAGTGPEPLNRRPTASRLSFGAAGSPAIATVAASRSSRLGTLMRQHDEGRFPLTTSSSAPTASSKRFLNEGKPPEDAAEIEDFLSMLDSKPDLRALDSSRSLPVESGTRSVIMSKRDIDEQLRMLKSSVFGNVSGTSGESPSPPAFTSALAAATSGIGGQSASPRNASGLSALRRQTSRLSIEEHPAEELAAAEADAAVATSRPVRVSPVRERLSPPTMPATDHGNVAGNGDGGNGLDRTPRGGYRTLKRDVLASPTLSATSSSTALPPPPLSGESPLRVEPRFLPLPTSSTTSPLASPRHQPHAPPFPCMVPSVAQPYPPLPYPPAVTTTVSTSTDPIPFSPYISRASRQSGVGPTRAGAGETAFGLSTIESERTSMTASMSSLSTRDDGDGEQENSYRGEEEAVGRLELDDSPALSQEGVHAAERRGRPAWSGLSPEAEGGDGDEDMGTLAAAAIRHSRDPTPAARQHPAQYFSGSSRRSRSRGGAISPPDMPWMA